MYITKLLPLTAFYSASTLLLSVAFLLSFGAASVSAEVSLFVSADAAAGGDGTQDAPFTNLVEARDALRKKRVAKEIKAGETVRFRIAPGVYTLSHGFSLEKQDGGSDGAPVIYERNGEGEVFLEGGIRLSLEDFHPVEDPIVRKRFDESVRDKIRVLDLSKIHPDPFPSFQASFGGLFPSPSLYQGNTTLSLARWPNAPFSGSAWAKFTKVADSGIEKVKQPDGTTKKVTRPGAFYFDDLRPQRWNLDEGAWLYGYWTHDWSAEALRVKSYSATDKILKLAAPHVYGIGLSSWGGGGARRFYAFNTLDELDASGEWYLDREKKLLYWYPTDSPEPLILATSTKPVLTVNEANYVIFRGLSIRYAHGNGFLLKNCVKAEVRDCQISHVMGWAGKVEEGRENILDSNEVSYVGTGGFAVAGGNRKQLIPAGHRIENNHIHHFSNFIRTYMPGIRLNGMGQIVRNNLIHHAPHSAIIYGGNEHLIELNEIHHVVQETADAGAIYTGRDWTSQGNILQHNYIHDIGTDQGHSAETMGVYLDDCDSGDTVTGNVFLRAGRAFMLGGGRENPFVGNVIIDSAIAIHFDSRGMTWKDKWNQPGGSWHLEGKAEAMDYQKPPWSERYPRLAKIMQDSPQEPLYNDIRSNLIIGMTKKVLHLDKEAREILPKLDVRDNVVVKNQGQEMLENVQGFQMADEEVAEKIMKALGDLRSEHFHPNLGEESPIREVVPGFLAIPFEKIGLRKKD